MTVTLHVCITCRAGQTLQEGETTPGSRLHAAILGLGAPEGVQVTAVECLSACNQGCSVALSAPGRWSYVYGRLSDTNARDVVAGAVA
jgi:predicted metal-binding protein